MVSVQDPLEVIDFLRKHYPGAAVIGIDGVDGAGKSTLALHVATALGGTAIDTDDYVAKNKGAYVAHLNRERLARAVHGATGAAVIAGVCLRNVLEAVPVEPDVTVYVKRMRHGVWLDADEGDPPEDVEAHLDSLAKEMALFAQLETDIEGAAGSAEAPGIPSFKEEVIRYHARWRPADSAQLTYFRSEE